MTTSQPISSILHHKKTTLWSVTPDTTVFDAIKLMAEKNIGALPVIVNGELHGVFTERDYTRKVALQGKTSKETRVREIMTGQVFNVTPADSVATCMKLMNDHRVRHLPVIESGKVVGIVSIGDLVNWVISAQGATIEQMERYIAGGVAA
jgi:CBS domain-containing protein